MENVHLGIAALTAIILFVFGLDNFSREVEKIAGENFRRSLGSLTRIPLVGVVIGALITAVIQSSSATSVITISLVNAGVISFKNSVGIIFGANVGTTITAQLVAFKLTAFAPVFIILGFVISLLRSRISIFGKAVFYFGFVFFSLNLISASLQPLQQNEALVSLLSAPQNPLYAILLGGLFTALVQSSSVTTGLAIIFTQQGILGLENAVPLILGANIGTTATGLIAVFGMDTAAKKAAFAHFLFNVGGVVLVLPILFYSGDLLTNLTTDPAIALANIHMAFNIASCGIFLLLINPFCRLIDRVLGEGKMDYERLPLPQFDADAGFDQVRHTLDQQSPQLLAFLMENYQMVTLSLETNYKTIYEAAVKRIEYFEFLKQEYLGYFSKAVSQVTDEVQSRELIALINRFDYLFQIHDSIVDLFETKRIINTQYLELKSDILMLIRDISTDTLSLFNTILGHHEHPDNLQVTRAIKELQTQIDIANRRLLSLLADPTRRDAGALTNYITYSQRLKDKLLNFSTRSHTSGDLHEGYGGENHAEVNDHTDDSSPPVPERPL